jgi:hypothetical protein
MCDAIPLRWVASRQPFARLIYLMSCSARSIKTLLSLILNLGTKTQWKRQRRCGVLLIGLTRDPCSLYARSEISFGEKHKTAPSTVAYGHACCRAAVVTAPVLTEIKALTVATTNGPLYPSMSWYLAKCNISVCLTRFMTMQSHTDWRINTTLQIAEPHISTERQTLEISMTKKHSSYHNRFMHDLFETNWECSTVAQKVYSVYFFTTE